MVVEVHFTSRMSNSTKALKDETDMTMKVNKLNTAELRELCDETDTTMMKVSQLNTAELRELCDETDTTMMKVNQLNTGKLRVNRQEDEAHYFRNLQHLDDFVPSVFVHHLLQSTE